MSFADDWLANCLHKKGTKTGSKHSTTAFEVPLTNGFTQGQRSIIAIMLLWPGYPYVNGIIGSIRQLIFEEVLRDKSQPDLLNS